MVADRFAWLHMGLFLLVGLVASCGDEQGPSDAATSEDTGQASLPSSGTGIDGGQSPKPAKLFASSRPRFFVLPATFSDREPILLSVYNGGDEDTGPLSAVLSGPQADELAVEILLDPIPPGQARMIDLSVRPNDPTSEPEPGTLTKAKLTVTDAGPAGTAVEIDLTIIFLPRPNGLAILGPADLPTVKLGERGKIGTFLVANTSLVDSSPLSVSISSSEFAKEADTCSGSSIPSGRACTVSITFAPAATGSRLAALTIRDSGTLVGSLVLEGTGVGD